MPWWGYLAIYVVGYLATARVIYSMLVRDAIEEAEEKNRKLNHDRTGRPYQIRSKGYEFDEEEQGLCLGKAVGLGALWPLVITVGPAIAFIGRTTKAEKDMKRRADEAKELEALRKQAKELGLPFPNIDIKPLGETP